jgi:hypothetical protein
MKFKKREKNCFFLWNLKNIKKNALKWVVGGDNNRAPKSSE